MKEILDSKDPDANGMNAVTEPIPRVVVLRSHQDEYATSSLPIVRARPRAQTLGSTPRRTSPALPAARRRASAPRSLRFAVTLLVALLISGIGGMVAQQVHPRWFTGLEHYIYPAARTGRIAHALDGATLVSSAPAAIRYSVPASTYSIVISVDHPCWIIVRSPAGGSAILREMTVVPATSPMTILIHGSSSIMVAAQTNTIALTEGTRELGVLRSPRVGVVYSFVPRG